MLCVLILQVVVVAVPAVLGIASIRIYQVKEKPTEGLLPRERVRCPNIPTGLFLQNSLPQIKLFVQVHIYIVIMLLLPVEHLHPTAPVCPSSGCSGTAWYHPEWHNNSQREHPAICPD